MIFKKRFVPFHLLKRGPSSCLKRRVGADILFIIMTFLSLKVQFYRDEDNYKLFRPSEKMFSGFDFFADP